MSPSNTSLSPPSHQSAIGIMNQMWATADIGDAEFLQGTIEDVQLADELGYHSIWLAEHHYVRDDSFYSRLPDPEILIARLIGETANIRLATGIKILLLDDPARAVERLRLLDLLSGNRVLFGLGQGSPDELGVLNLTTEERRHGFRSKLREFTEMLRSGLGAGERALTPGDGTDPAKTVWIGVRDAESIELAAALGLNFIVGEAEVGRRQAHLIRAYRDAGGGGEARGARLVCVGETDGDAMAAAMGPGRELYERFRRGVYYLDAVKHGLLPESEAADDREALRRLEYVVGSPQTVLEGLTEYVETTGVDALNILVHTPGMDRQAARRSLTLFMNEVAAKLPTSLARNVAASGSTRADSVMSVSAAT